MSKHPQKLPIQDGQAFLFLAATDAQQVYIKYGNEMTIIADSLPAVFFLAATDAQQVYIKYGNEMTIIAGSLPGSFLRGGRICNQQVLL